MVSTKEKTIALITVGAVSAALLVAYIAVPRDTDDTLTPQQQQMVDDRLDHCFATGDC